MTAAELIIALAKLPHDTQVCFMAGDQKGTILEVTEVRAVDVTGNEDGYYAALGHYGDRKVAVIT